MVLALPRGLAPAPGAGERTYRRIETTGARICLWGTRQRVNRLGSVFSTTICSR